jgi:hypothetical protein
VLAGCTAPVGPGEDPYGDRLGWEDGYWYDDPLNVTTEDGLNESEQEAVVARTMARVERIRGLEFERTVPVEVVSRAAYRNRSNGPGTGDGNETFGRWNDQVWEALFLVGEDRSFESVFGDVLGESVLGFYSPAEDRIVIVSDDPTPRLDRATLAHELVHALQDQHHGFGPSASTQDRQLANDGLVEGDATVVTRVYEQRCAGEWDCIPTPRNGGGGGDGAPEALGVFVTIYQPYATGPGFVETLRDRGGWRAVDDAYRRFPESTEQVIHPERYPREAPVEVSVDDRTAGGWERFDLEQTTDTVGEASIYAMLKANGQLPETPLYGYDAEPSAGWGGDVVVPYRNGDRYGYVFRTTWDTERDARQFAEAYRGVLRAHNATREGNVWRVPDSDPFGDAFRVTRDGRTVTVVNAPTKAELGEVHASG